MPTYLTATYVPRRAADRSLRVRARAEPTQVAPDRCVAPGGKRIVAALLLAAALVPLGRAYAQQHPKSLEGATQRERAKIESGIAECRTAKRGKAEEIHTAIGACDCPSEEKRASEDELARALDNDLAACRRAGEAALARFRRGVCEGAVSRAARDRQAIARNAAALAQGQRELETWKRMSDDAQSAALLDAMRFFLGRFAEETSALSAKAAILEGRVAALTQRAANARTQARRFKAAARLDRALTDWTATRAALLPRAIASTALSADQAWRVAQGTWQHEFRVAAKRNAAIREVLEDPEFREAFLGESGSGPGLEVVSELTAEALKTGAAIGDFAKLAGPTVAAGEFVIAESYNALASLLATQRVVEGNAVAGSLARAAGVLQKHHESTLAVLNECRTAGLL